MSKEQNNRFEVPGSTRKKIQSNSINPPRIAGALYDALLQKQKREIHENLSLGATNNPVIIRDPDEIALTAFSLIFLQNILRASDTRLKFSKMDNLLSETLNTLGPAEVMELEIEAYDTLHWLYHSMQSIKPDDLNNEYNDKTPTNLDKIQEAIDNGWDLMIGYYSVSTGEFNTRQITPIKLEAEKFLSAFCHLRHEERNFRINRISKIEFVTPISKKLKKIRHAERKDLETFTKTRLSSNTIQTKTPLIESKVNPTRDSFNEDVSKEIETQKAKKKSKLRKKSESQEIKQTQSLTEFESYSSSKTNETLNAKEQPTPKKKRTTSKKNSLLLPEPSSQPSLFADWEKEKNMDDMDKTDDEDYSGYLPF